MRSRRKQWAIILAGLVGVIGLAAIATWQSFERQHAPTGTPITLRVGVYDNAPKVYVDRDGRP